MASVIYYYKPPLRVKQSTNMVDVHQRLRSACRNGNVEQVQALLEQKADVNTASGLPRGQRQFPLHVAARRGSTEVVKLLIEHRALVNNRDDYGTTALMEACIEGHYDVVMVGIVEGGMFGVYVRSLIVHMVQGLGFFSYKSCIRRKSVGVGK